MEILYNDLYQCSKCKSQYENRQDYKLMSRKLRDSKGCVIKSEKPRYTVKSRFSNAKFSFHKCIGNYFGNDGYYWFDLYESHKRGIPVYNGPLNLWPAKVMEIFSVIESKQCEKREEQRKKAERDMARQKMKSR